MFYPFGNEALIMSHERSVEDDDWGIGEYEDEDIVENSDGNGGIAEYEDKLVDVDANAFQLRFMKCKK